MDYDALEEIARESEKTWQIPYLRLDLCHAKEATVPSNVDLVAESYRTKILGRKKQADPRPDEQLWFSPKDFNKDDQPTRLEIVKILNTALKPNHCQVSIQGHRSYPHANGKGATRNISLKCFRGVKQRKSTGKKLRRNKPSIRAKENLCEFQIRVTCKTTDKSQLGTSRYYIRTNFGQCFCHRNHDAAAKQQERYG